MVPCGKILWGCRGIYLLQHWECSWLWRSCLYKLHLLNHFMNQALHFGDNDFSRLSFVFFQRGVQFCQAQRSDTLLQRQERHFKKIPPPKLLYKLNSSHFIWMRSVHYTAVVPTQRAPQEKHEVWLQRKSTVYWRDCQTNFRLHSLHIFAQKFNWMFLLQVWW